MRVAFSECSAFLCAAGLLISPLTASAEVRPHHHTSTHAMVRHTGTPHATRAESSGSEHTSGMSPDRATEIQSALIQHGYLSGEHSGSWDSASYNAMEKLQSDNGWQTKMVPDARALIKLGLGPGTTPAAAPIPATPASAAAPGAPQS